MKRNLFVLVFSLMLLSFGQSFADITYGPMTFSSDATGAGVYMDGAIKTINTNASFTIEVAETYTPGGGDVNRQTFVSPFQFTGTGIASITWADPTGDSYWLTTFRALFDGGVNFTYAEPPALPASLGLFSYAGAANNLGVPAGSITFLHAAAMVTLTDPDGTGEICISQGDAIDPSYDWVFDDPVPTFTQHCWPVKKQPNPPPVITNCEAQMTTQHDVPFVYDFTATDADPISWTANYGTVSGTGTTFHWTFDPPCSMVGQSVTLTICAGDPFHICPLGTICTVDLVVLNTAPEIHGDCGNSYTVGEAPMTANFTATDANLYGDSKTWTVANVVPPVPSGTGAYNITSGGVFTFDPTLPADIGSYVFTIRVTDCAGAFDECTISVTVVSSMPFGIKIDKLHKVLQGHHAYVPVIKTKGSEEIYGFDFLIAYDNSALSFMGATAGDMWDIPGANEWEYFTYRFGPFGNCGNGCPTGQLRVVGISDQNNGPHHPVSFNVDDLATLFTLDFFVSNDRTLECMYVPIRFYWMDCGDNTVAYHPSTGEPLEIITGVSDHVYDYMAGEITDIHAVFPTYKGANETCFADTVTICDTVGQVITCRFKGPVRFVDFYDGAIDIICSGDIDARGDVNLNGIRNEIGDAVVFTNYFIAGLAAFTINEEGQIAATEINGDGIVLTVADLVYLIRTIVGDVTALPKVSPYTTTAHFITNGSVVSVDQVLGGAYFVFDGKADVSLAEGASNVELRTGTINGNAVALVIDTKNATAFSGNILNTNGTIKSIQASDVNGNLYKTNIVPATFSIRNYPNPFNPSTAIEMALPVASNWTVSVYNVAGQKVFETSGYNEAGVHQVEWNATAQASGIYFYKVDAGKFSATKKMVLLK